MSPKVIRSSLEMQKMRANLIGKKVGFVPTMGALHAGHSRLLEIARSENDIVVLSIFVNPTQFNNPSDLEKYPITWENDLSLATAARVDCVFAPTYAQIYPDTYRYQVTEKSFSKILCGKDRPGHFDGVLTVVLKLFNIVQPQRAYFGEKDFQQLQLVRGMAEALFIPVEIIGVPTVRDEDGLAKSSRNLRLTKEQRSLAPQIYQTIVLEKNPQSAAKLLADLGFDVDYVEDFEGRRFVAAKLGDIRLIDNIPVHEGPL